jgi:hypothetical protein
MAKSLGILRLSGNIEGLSFYEYRGQIIVRRPGGFNGAKIKSSPRYKKTRELNREFSEASAVNVYFRGPMKQLIKRINDSHFHSRVQQLMVQLIGMDTTHERGSRTVATALQTPEGWQHLMGFEFDPDCRFSTVFPFATEWNAAAGQLTVRDFQPDCIQAPKGATHVGLQVLHLGMDWTLATPATRSESTLQFYALQPETPPTTLELTVPDTEGASRLVVLCVGFYLEAQESLLPLAGMAMHSIAGHPAGENPEEK